MPKPIVCLCLQLRQFMEDFRPCFSKRQWKYFVTVLLGLIECEERRTMTGLLRVVGERISLSGLSRFLSKWPWSAGKVAQTWMLRFRQRLEPLVQAEHNRLKAQRPARIGRPKATVVTDYLIFDDSVHAKPKGQKMGGLGLHYSSTEQRVVAGHCLFTGLYVLLSQRCPLPVQMYRHKSVCQQEGVAFQSKIDMAIKQIESFEPVTDTHTHVLIDSWYHCKRVRPGQIGRIFDRRRMTGKRPDTCTARRRKPAEEKRALEDYDWEIDDESSPQAVTCPGGQKTEVHPGRNEQRYLACFDAELCRECPHVEGCPSAPLKRTARHALRFSQPEMSLAMRRQRSADARAQGRNLRAAAESTMRSVKHPFGNGKLPVRGKPRVSMMMIASAAMTNIRRIHGYQERLREEERKAGGDQRPLGETNKDAFVFLWRLA